MLEKKLFQSIFNGSPRDWEDFESLIGDLEIAGYDISEIYCSIESLKAETNKPGVVDVFERVLNETICQFVEALASSLSYLMLGKERSAFDVYDKKFFREYSYEFSKIVESKEFVEFSEYLFNCVNAEGKSEEIFGDFQDYILDFLVDDFIRDNVEIISSDNWIINGGWR